MKCNTQNKKIAAITENTLVVGIDVGSEKHYARAFDWRNIEYSKKPFEFNNDEEGFNAILQWIEDVKGKNGKTAVIPGMEPTGHYWINLGIFLQEHGMKPVHVNPHHVKKSKELDDNNPSKNDRKDPKVIAALVNEGRYSYPYLPEGVYAELRSLSGQLDRTESQLTRVKNQIARWFSIYFPNYKDVYKKLDAKSGLMILKKAPLPADIVKLGVEGMKQIWRDAKLRGTGEKRAKALVTAAEHSIGSQAAPIAARNEIEDLVKDYETMAARKAKLMVMIKEKIVEVPYAEKLLGINGIGMKTVIGFVAEVGDISRFKDAKEIQKLAGYAIVANESGKHKGGSHISYRGRKHLRYVLYEAAISVIRHSSEFMNIHMYYTTRPKNPLNKMQSVVTVACKLIRIFFLILKKGTTYNPGKMIGDIRRTAAA